MKQKNHAREKRHSIKTRHHKQAITTDAKHFLHAQLRRCRGALVQTLCLSLCDGVIIVVQAWLFANLFQQLIFQHGRLGEHVSAFYGLLPLFVIRIVIRWYSKQRIFIRTQEIKHALRAQCLAHIASLGPIKSTQIGTGRLIHLLSDGIEGLEAYYARYLPAKFMVVLLPLIILFVIVPIDWLAALVMIVTAPLIPFFMILIGKQAQDKNHQQWRQLAQMSGYFLDRLQGLMTLKIFGASQREACAIKSIANAYRHDTMAVLRVAFLSSLALEFLATVAIAMIAILIGFRLMWGEMSLVHGLFVLLLAPEFYLPLRQMGGHYHARMDAVAAAEQLSDLLAHEVIKDDAPQELWCLNGLPEIIFDNVCLTHQEDNGRRTALNKVNLKLKAGEMFALMGESGSGKSSIADLLLRFIEPDSGTIKINGQPLQQIPKQSWQKKLAWVPQQPYLFYGTIAQNIALATPDADMECIITAAKQANLHHDINRMPQGYETKVGERGVGLSGGQIRRVALARAFLRDAPLIILDEPTASLDAKNERYINDAIQQLAKNRTVLLITHRALPLHFVDRIGIMQDGQIVKISPAYKSHRQTEALCLSSGD